VTRTILPKIDDWAVPGFTASAVAADVRGKGPGPGGDRLDMGLIHCPDGAGVAGVFTRNAMAAAPVLICRERLAGGRARAVLVNSGRANCMTGSAGREDALSLCRTLAGLLGAPESQVFPSSTGVIGGRLPVARMAAAMPALAAGLSPQGMEPFSRAIMTTDTRPKAAAARIGLAGGEARILGVAKGSGMIAPNMATMLSYILTDAAVPAAHLSHTLADAAAGSFNAVTVDGDTSTNDTVLLLASGKGPSLRGDRDRRAFSDALAGVCLALAEELVADGEGATRVVRVRVSGARSNDDAARAARAVANSPLVKTALAAGDPNWGRIAGAVGYSGADTSPALFSLSIGGVAVVRGGEPVPGYDEGQARRAMMQERFTLDVSIGDGPDTSEVLTCDLTEEYVRINKDYRT
jgi:glutamate N-acetyltransferase / amino-acid N-acetyltransferase